MDRLLWYVFAGSRGGVTRTRIVRSLLDLPKNAHQVSRELGMDYKTVEYNLRVLSKHRYVVSRIEGYGKPWELSLDLLAVLDEFHQVTASVSE